MPITALPTPPLPTDTPADFNTKAFALLGALPTFVTEANALETAVDADATTATTQAGIATTQAGIAATKVIEAQSAATSAAAIAGATQWVSGTTYSVGDVVWSPINQQTYRRKVAGAGTTDPSADTANWTQVGGGSSNILRSARTSNSQLVKADAGKLIDITSGTFTQTFDAAATLGDGWFCYLRNSGTGDITLDPNGAEQIDGLTSFVMYPGEVRIIQCDGVSLRSIVIQAYNKTSISSLTFIRPPGYKAHEGILWSGGAGGGFGGSTALVYGGRGGGAFPFTIPHEAMPASVVVQIGAGGSSRSTTGGANPGGDSVFGSLFMVKGATATACGAFSLDGATALSGSSVIETSVFAGGGINTNWGGTLYSSDLMTVPKSLWGGAAGASWNGPQSAANPSGVSVFGGNGGAIAQPGFAPGGGGGASHTANAGLPSGAGARGELRIWGII